MSSVEHHQARVVVTGIGTDGRSTIVSDRNSPTRIVTPTFAVGDVWRMESVPTTVDADNASGANVVLSPPHGGLIVRTVAFPPDSEWKGTGGYGEAMAAIDGADSYEEDKEIDGLHATDTVDVIVVISGELYAVLQDAEVLLRQGDTLIQRGTKHAWSNRSDKPAIIAAMLVSATR